MTLLIKLFLAHLLGDFFLQPDSWVKQKEQLKLKAPKFYLHILIHGILMIIITWDVSFWLPALIIMITHGLIDAIKVTLQRSNTQRLWFIIDQLLHVVSIVAIWYWWENPSITKEHINSHNVLIYITSIVILTNPTSILIKVLISRWMPTLTSDTDSLPSAGKIIGILERLFVLAFVLTNHWEAIGFLLTAKSVFRFGDLKDSHDRKLTEYVLIGTLLSFGIAIIVGLFISFLLIPH